MPTLEEVDILHRNRPNKRGNQFRIVKHNGAREFLEKHGPNLLGQREVTLHYTDSLENAQAICKRQGWTIIGVRNNSTIKVQGA